MTLKQWFAVGALASMSFAVTAQRAPERPDPLDASAAVPAPVYKSAFENFQKESNDGQPSADKVWRAANDALARSDAHGEHAARDTAAKTPASDHGKHH
jgi:hypothetical protein